MIMKLLGFCLLPSFIWALQTPQMGTCLCWAEEPTLHRYNRLTRQMELVEEEEEWHVKNLSCLLYPEKMLRCTMLGQYLTRGSQLFISVNISDVEGKTSTLLEPFQPSEKPSDSKPIDVCRVDPRFFSLTVLLNVSGPDTHNLYCHHFSSELLEVLSPPPNITAEVKEGLLLVSWGLPYSLSSRKPWCFDYQVDDKQEVYDIEGKNNLERPVDPATGYAVRIRTRKNPYCLGPEEWSAWSDTIDLPAGSRYKLNTVLICSLLFGTPMIVLALLLLLRKHRVLKLLFPQIPQLPKKYKHFLKRPPSCSFPPMVQPAYEEDITVVEDTQSSNDELKHDL